MPQETSPIETPEPEVASDAVTDEPSADDPLAALATAMNDGFDKIAKIMVAHQEQIDELKTVPAPDTMAAPAEPRAPRVLPEGTFRFWSPYKDYAIWIEPAGRMVVDGRPHHNYGKLASFSQGIFDTDDAGVADYLRNHKVHGSEFVEAADAQPHAGVTVIDGPKTSGMTARTDERPAAELSVPL